MTGLGSGPAFTAARRASCPPAPAAFRGHRQHCGQRLLPLPRRFISKASPHGHICLLRSRSAGGAVSRAEDITLLPVTCSDHRLQSARFDTEPGTAGQKQNLSLRGLNATSLRPVFWAGGSPLPEALRTLVGSFLFDLFETTAELTSVSSQGGKCTCC